MSGTLHERIHLGDPRRFVLERDTDETGVSGVGTVAWGVAFPDGAAVTRWNAAIAQTCAWQSIADVVAVHGHGGRTRIVWLDAIPDEAMP